MILFETLSHQPLKRKLVNKFVLHLFSFTRSSSCDLTNPKAGNKRKVKWKARVVRIQKHKNLTRKVELEYIVLRMGRYKPPASLCGEREN